MKLFVTDYDRTLYINDENFKINKKMLLELHKLGVIIAISTGRCFESIKRQLIENNIYYDYIHCADGSIIYDKDDHLISFSEMDPSIINQILSLKEEAVIEEVQIIYPKRYESTYNSHDKVAGINLIIKTESVNKDFVNKFLNLKRKFTNYNFLYYEHIDFAYLCVKKEHVNKAYGIKIMEKILNINPKDIYVIGDSYNDREMIQEYNGVSIIGNEEINKLSKKCYHYVYEYINKIKEDLFTKN